MMKKDQGFFGHPLIPAVRALSPREIAEIKRSKKNKEKYAARLRAMFPYIVDISDWREKVEDVEARYKSLDDPITLWPHVRHYRCPNPECGS